jgi:hypothetical protein
VVVDVGGVAGMEDVAAVGSPALAADTAADEPEVERTVAAEVLVVLVAVAPVGNSGEVEEVLIARSCVQVVGH